MSNQFDIDEPRLDDLKLVSPRLDSSNWQIRIEALRAASRITSAIAGRNTSGDLQTVTLAKRFERYLESGE